MATVAAFPAPRNAFEKTLMPKGGVTMTAAAQKSDEEVMYMRGINQKLEGELAKLRASFEERERAMEQLASDATNVENIDLPQLQVT